MTDYSSMSDEELLKPTASATDYSSMSDEDLLKPAASIAGTGSASESMDFDSMSDDELHAEHRRRVAGVGSTTPNYGVGSASETDAAINKRIKKVADMSERGLVGKGKKWLGFKDGEDHFEYDAENAPAFVPNDDEGKALYERVKGYKGATLSHHDRPMRINRDKDGKAESYSTTESTVVPELDGTWSVIPTMWKGENGETISAIDDEEAATHYRDTEKGAVGSKVGERYGNFKTEEEAKAAAQEIHELHSRMYQQKWNQWLHEHWDDVPDNIKNDPEMAKVHAEWEKAGKPGIRFSMKDERPERKGGEGKGEEDPWKDLYGKGETIGVLEKLQLDLQAKTGKKFSKGEALAYTLAPLGQQSAGLDANMRAAALEVLRSGDYDEKDAKTIAEVAGLHAQFDEIHKMTVGGEENKLKGHLRMAAEDALRDQVIDRQDAGRQLQFRPQTNWGKAASGFISTMGYGNSFLYGSAIMPTMALSAGAGTLAKLGVGVVNSVSVGAPVTVAGALETGTGLANKSYEIDEYDRIKVIDDNYDALTAGLRGTAKSVAENIVVEDMTGAALDAAFLGLAKLPIVKSALEPLKKKGSEYVRKLWGSNSGRALIHLGRVVNATSQLTNLASQPSEMFEENIQPIFDDVLGLDKRKGEERDSFTEYLGKTFSWERQGDIFLGLIGVSILHGSLGYVLYKTDPNVRKAVKDASDARKVLVGDAEQDKKRVDSLTDEETIGLANLYRRFSSNPKLAQELANKLGEHAGSMMDDMLSREGAKMGGDLEDMGVQPVSFKIPTRQGVGGRPEVDFRQKEIINYLTEEVAVRNVVVDEDTGVYIIDNGLPTGSDAAFTVRDDVLGESVDCMSIAQARQAATNMMRKQQLLNKRDASKFNYIDNLVNRQYGKADVEHYASVEEAIEASKAHGFDVTQSRAFNPRRQGWRLPNGTVILVRNNISSPWEVDNLLRHETIGHSKELNDVVFLDAVAESENEISRKNKRILQYGPVVGGTERAIREAVALIIQEHPAMPTKGQKFTHAVKSWLKDHGMDFGMSDADIEVKAAKVAESMKGEGGEQVHGGRIYSGGDLVSFITTEETTDETGNRADEAQPQPEQGENAEPPAAEEARPVESGEAQGETPRVVNKPVEARSVIEKMTDQAPVEELPVAEVFNDDTRIPNFKEGANPETGEVEPLTGEPYDLVSNPIVVMEFKDGKKVVVTGRHRLALYRRSGRDKIAARVIREADGWTVNDAKMIDSIGNIIDEKGSVKDYVRYFEDAKPSREAAEAGGFLARPKGHLAYGIYEGASEDTRAAIDFEGGGADGQISVEQAGIIAEAAPVNAHPRNKALQRILVSKALNGLRGKKLGILARSLAEEVKRDKTPSSVGGEMQLDLFSSAEDQALLAMEDKRAEYRTRKSQEYTRIAAVLRTAMSKGGKLDLNERYARELGITDAKDKSQLSAARDRAVERANYWENAIRLDDADKAAMDAEIGASAKKAEEKKSEVAKRLKAIKENKPKTPKNAPTSTSAETAVTTPQKSAKPVEGRKSGAASNSVTQKQIEAFAEWRQNNSNAKVHSVFLRNDGTVSFGYEDGSGVARSAYLYADGERSSATPVHITWKDFDEIHGENAVRIDESDLGTKTPEAEKPVEGRRNPVVAIVHDEEALEAMRKAVKKVSTKDLERHLATPGYRSEYKQAAQEELDRRKAESITEKPREGGQVIFGTVTDRGIRVDRVIGGKTANQKKSVVLKDAERAKEAQSQANDLMSHFASPEFDMDSAILSGDEVRKTMPGYNRLDWRTHVDRTGFVGPRLEAQFKHLLKSRKGKGNGTVVFLAGGNGVGKSTLASKLGLAPDFTIDSTLGNLEVAKKQIDAIIANGQLPVIFFVYRNYGQALDGIAKRIKNGGHIVSPLSFANSHVKSRENLRLLSDHYGDKIQIHIYDNSMPSAPKITLEELEAKRKPEHERIRKEANFFLENLSAGFDRQNGSANSGSDARGVAQGEKGEASGVAFASPEFDPEKFQQRVGAMAKLVSTLNKEGYNDFKSLATYLAENFPKEKFEAAKPYLRPVWNAVADAMDLEEVSKKDAESIYTDIEKSYNAPTSEEKADVRNIQESGRSDARQSAASSGTPSERDDSDAQSQGAGAHSAQSGEGGAGTVVHDGAAGRPLLHVERPEMAVGTVSGGRAEGDRKGAEGSASVAGSDGRTVEGSRTGVGGSGSGVELGSGSSDNVEGRERSGGERVVETVRETLTEEAPNTVKNENYIITDADERAIEGGKPRDKVRANIEAIRIVRKLAEDGRDATPDEKTKLARYVGWGGLRAAFNNTYYNAYEREQSEGTLPPQTWAAIRKTPLGEEGYDLYKQMRELLSQDEILSAENSTTSAFFTPIRLCRSIHKALINAGLKEGRLLETSAGIGNLIGTGNYTNPRWTAIELDKVTGQILKALYPKANVRIQGFEDVVMPDNFMDAAISNVPFGTEHPFDPNYKKYGFVVHDFFFAKAIDKIHPGGVAAFITATGTLDKRDKSLIRYLSEHGGKIVGAVRIPNGFFAKNAGTDVATDVVFIQKVEGKADNSQFLKTAEHRGCPISQYFLDRPELCMGRMVPGTNQFGQPELSYKATGEDYAAIDEAVQKAAAELKFTPVNELQKPSQIVDLVDSHGLANGNIGIVGGKVVRKMNDVLEEVPQKEIPKLTQALIKKGATAEKIIRGIETLRDAFRKCVDGQLADCSDAELKKLQDALNYEYSTFTKRYGALNSQIIKKFIDLDYAAAPLLVAMENVTVVDEGVDSKGNKKTSRIFSKADIFTKRTIFAKPKTTSAGSVMDGLRISLNESGTVSMARIAELTGKSEDEVKKELLDSGLVFVNPETSGIETRDEYLSGSVRRKLKAAQAAADIDPSFRKNVEALEKVQPEDIAATDISYQLGQNWIPRDIYEQFFKEAVYQNTSPKLTVSFDPREHLWHVDTKGRGQTEYDEESGLAVADLIERTMNGRSIVVRRRISDDEYVVDQEATTATKIVQEKIARAFQSWMTDDTARAERIERLYNDTMNDCVPRQHDTDVLEFYGLSKDWSERVGTKGREYQKRCIARGTFGGNLLIAHCVGAGKTFEMASICMQLRRLGIARKPMFAVPNHMLAQWNREFHEAYPGAKVLVADKKDLTKQNRRSFLARAANGDWDCIIVAHSSFSRIAMSPEHQAEYIEAELADLTDLLVRVENEKAKKKIRKQIQSKRDKLKALLDPSKKDDAIKFEELGCDYLFVDEAHNFKGIQINTHMSNVPGVTGSVSQRAQDLEMKCRYIAKLHGGDKGVVFATGTPISNSISEMYVMMRYLAPSKMDEMGIRNFDDWAKQFGQVVNEWSPNPSGVGFREKARFSQFQNVPEMKRFFRSFADIVLDSELKIKRPYMIGGKPIQHILKPSAATKAYVQELNRRMERMQNEKVDPTEDNMLKVTTEGRLLAIDPMLIGVKDESHIRANACADEVKRIYDKSTGKPVIDRDGNPLTINGTQLIFCDSGVPKKKQFKQLVRTQNGNYQIASGYWTLTVTTPDAYGNRQLYGELTDGQRITFSPVTDHTIDGREDLASVYTALEALQAKAAAVNAENKLGKGAKKAKKPDGTPVDINAWLDLNSDAIGYDPRFSNPYAVENEEASDSTEEEDSADDKDTSEEANGDVEVDNMLRGKFNMYAELKKQLVRRGIPSEEIAFIHDAETMKQKQALFDKVKSGKIRVLIGNTAKMGEGTNVQDRLVAIHHLDIPWKPAWITQRDGRGIRSGNLNDEIGIHTYITEGTFDVYSWDTVGRKAKFIENAMNSRMDQRTIEDVDSTVMSLEEGKAAAAGDPRILERVKLIKEIEKEQMAFDTQVKAFDRSQLKMRVAENELSEAEKRVGREREAIARYNAAKGDSPFTLTTMEEEPKNLTDNTDLSRYIQDKLGEFARRGSSVGIVGRLFGFDVRHESGEGTDRGHYMTIKEIGVRFPVTVLPGTGAAFPPSDLSKFKSEITRSTNPKYLESLNNYVEGYRKRLEVARKGVENAAGFDRDAASGKIGEMYHRLARLNRALGITDKTVRGIAATHLRERRGQEAENVAAALAAATPVEDNSVFAEVPVEARLRVLEQEMSDAYFASPEFDSDAVRLGIAKRDLENQARRLGRVPWRPKEVTWSEVYQRSEALLNQTGFIEELVADVKRYPRAFTAEQTLAVGSYILSLGRQYEELRTLRQDVEHSIVEATRDNATTDDLNALNKTLKDVKKEESEISKRYSTAYEAMRMSKAKQGLELAANRGLFSEEFDFLGMKEARKSALGRDLTPEEMRQLHDICDRARDLTEDARSELWAAVNAQAERTTKDLFMKDSVKRAGDSRKKKLIDYRKKYLDAMAHLKVWRDTVGGSLIGITGDEYGTWNRPLFDILLWHRFQNPDITAAQALQKVTQDVNTYITADDLTVARILTGFERSWDINRHDNVLKAGRDLRSQILTQLQIDSLLNKRMPGKTGPIPGEPSQELRDIRHTRDVLKNELEEETNDPRKLQGRMKRWMKWYDNRIEDLKREIAAGERLPQTKRTLLWTEEMKQKRAESEELIRERDRVCGKSGLSEEERIKRYEAQLERTLRRSVDRLLAARNDDFRRPDRPVAVTSDYIESLKKAIEDTNAEWRQEKRDRLMFGRTQAEINKLNENREKTHRKRIAYWQALTAPQADRSVEKRPQIPMPPEQQARYEKLGQQMKRLRRQVMDMRAHDELMKKPWLWRHGVEYARFVNGLTRGFLATADHSAVLRQMAQLSLSHPKLAAQVFKNTIGTAFSDEKAARINAELLSDPRIKEAVDKGWLNWRNLEAGGNSGDVELFSSLHSSAITVGRNADGTERRFSLDDIKGVGSVLRGSERIYATYINALSSEIYLALINADSFTAKLMFGQNGLTDFTKKEIAARINMANGSAQIDDAKKKQLMNQLTGIFWAPKLALSRLQLAVGWDVIHPLLDGSKDAKTRLRTAGFNAIEHARAKLAMIALGSLMLMLAGDDDDKEKLRRSSMFKQFLQVIKPRVGDTTLDFSGGEAGWYQLMSKWVTLEKETGTGKKVYLSDKDGHKQSFGADIMNDTFRFAQGKFNPLLSNAIAFWTGEDYVGQPFGLGDFALNTFVPLGASDMTEMFVENGLGRGLLLAPFVIFGAGGNTYKVKRYEIAVNQFTEAAKEYDAIREDGELSSDERSDLLSEMEESIPELKSRGRIEGKIKNVKYLESEIRKVQKSGGAVPQSLTDGLERAKKEALEAIREARKSVDNG